jgi:DNA-binding transcriptional MerR regulator
MKHPTYSIGDASKLTGASQKQIRRWEAKGYIPKTARIVYGDVAYRRFSLKQVERIARIKDFLDEGYSLAAAAEKAAKNPA